MAAVRLSRADAGIDADAGICGSDLDGVTDMLSMGAVVAVVGGGIEGCTAAMEVAVDGSDVCAAAVVVEDDIPGKSDTRLSGLLLLLR